MKTVLVQINRDDGQEARLQAALDVVKAFAGHLACLQVPPLANFAAADPYGLSYLIAETVETIRDLTREERQEIEARLASEGVGWDWHSHAGDSAQLLGDHSWLADLVVVSAPTDAWKPRIETPPTASQTVMRSRAPVLAVPDASRGFDCSAAVAVAWNGSPECCAALRQSLPLLRRASAIHLVSVREDDDYYLPSTQAAAYLARHGITSELVEVNPDGAPISDCLLEAAQARKAGCVVMGAYGHSRLRENILGGVTKGMLLKARLPLLLAH